MDGADLYGHALSLLRRALADENAMFRDGQFEAIEALARAGGRHLVVQRTGWGKTIVYFLTTRLFRDAGRGVTIVVSPLLSLMRNQIEAAALGVGGRAVRVLAEGVERQASRKVWRGPLRDGRLALVSTVGPQARFTVGNAMARNRLIYALSECAVVVSSGRETGGTWAGAIENLRHGWAPLWVRDAPGVPPGNEALLQKAGVCPLAEPRLAADNGAGAREERGAHAAARRPAAANGPEATDVGAEGASPRGDSCEEDLFVLVRPALARLLRVPRTSAEVGERAALTIEQSRKWLKRACTEGWVVKSRDGNEIRYVCSCAP